MHCDTGVRVFMIYICRRGGILLHPPNRQLGDSLGQPHTLRVVVQVAKPFLVKIEVIDRVRLLALVHVGYTLKVV